MENADDASLQRLTRVLAEWDAPCPCCGYSLLGLRGPTCPECGEAIELRVGVAEPRMGAFIAGLIGLASGTGFGALVTAFFFIARAVRGPAMDARPMAPVLLMLIAGTVSLAAWIRWRARVRRLSPPKRGLLVIGCWALTLGTAAWFILLTL